MVMFQRSKTLLALAAALLMTAGAVEANAGSRVFHHNRHHAVKRIIVRTHVRFDSRIAVNIGPRRHHVRGVDTYSGEVAVSYRSGVGAWSYGTASIRTNRLALQPNAKIVDVSGGRTGCSMEKGVCVIRP
jgi:hypothetical protein